MSKTLSNTIYYSISIYVEFFIGLIISVLIARSLLPEDYGHYSFYLWVSALLMLLINGGMPTALTKFISELNSDAPERMHYAINRIRRIYYFTTVLVIAVFMVVIAIYSYVADTGGYLPYFIVAIAVLFKSKYMQYVGYYKGFESFKTLAIISLYIPPINLIFVVVVAYFYPGIMQYLYAYLAVSILYMLLAMRLDKNASVNVLGAEQGDGELDRRIYRHYFISTVLTFLNFIIFKQSEIFFLKIFVDEQTLAFFNIGYLLGISAATLIPGIYSGLLLPIMSRLYNKAEDRVRKTYLNAVRYLVILGVPLIILTFIIGKLLIITMYGEAYSYSYHALLGCILAATIQTISSAATSLMTGTDKHNILLRILITGGMVKIVIDVLMVKFYGLNGAIIAYVVSSLFVSFSYMIFISSHYKFKHEYLLYTKVIVISICSGILPALLIFYVMNPVMLIVAPIIYGVFYIGLISKTNCLTGDEKEKIQQLAMNLQSRILK